MKAKLIFNLPEDDYDFQNAVNGSSWRAVVTEMDVWLREQVKYGDPKTIDAEMARDKLLELVNDEQLEI